MAYIYRLDVLRVLGAFMIVGCHLVFQPEAHSYYEFAKRFTDLFVGVFGLISGFLMVFTVKTKQTKWTLFVSKRIKRLLLPYLAWSLFFVSANCLFDHFMGHPLTFNIWSAKQWIITLVTGSSGPHLWFLVALFYGQLVLYWPVRFMSEKKYAWLPFLCLGVLALAVAVACAEKVSCWSEFGIYHVRLFAYLAFGISLAILYPKLKNMLNESPVSIRIIWAVWLMISCTLFQMMSEINGFWLEAILAIPIFVWGLIDTHTSHENHTFVCHNSTLSMGIYCIHPIFTVFLYTIFTKMKLGAWDSMIFFDWVLSWGLAYGCAAVMNRIKYLKWLVT